MSTVVDRTRMGLVGRPVKNLRLFWATVCKAVRPMLSDRCLSVCLSVLSVTLVYCVQTVGQIKVKLGTQVGLGPGRTV